jgi:hypothetical protein
LGTPNNVVLVPVVPPPNSEGVVVVPPAEEGGFVVFPKTLPPLPHGKGEGVGGFVPSKPPEVVPGAGVVEVGTPNKLPPVAGVVVVVPGAGVAEVAPKSEPAGLVPKMFPGVVAFVPVPVVPVPVAPVLVAGVMLDVVFV